MVNVMQGEIRTSDENVQISDPEELKLLDTNDHYKFLQILSAKAQLKITDTKCRMCGNVTESTTHVMCARTKSL